MTRLLAACFVFCLVLGATSATNPGATLSLSQAALTYITTVVKPLVDNLFNNFKLPEQKLDKDGFDIHVFSIHTDKYSGCDISIEFVSGKGLQLKLDNLDIKIHSHWDAKEKGFPYLSSAGYAEIETKNGGVTLLVQMTESGGQPQLSLVSNDFNLGDFDIDFTGSFLDGLLDALKDIFKSQIDDAIKSAGDSAIEEEVKNVNKQLQKAQLDYPLASWGSEIRFGFTANPTVTSSYLGVPLLGDVIDSKQSYPLPSSISPPSIPPFNSASGSKYLQLAVSTYSFETAAWVYQQHGDLQRTVSYKQIGANSPITLNTTDLSIVAPGLKAKYPNRWCNLHLQAVNVSTAATSPSKGLTVSVPTEVTVQVVLSPNSTVDAFTVGCDIEGGIDLSIVSGSPSKLSGSISNVTCVLKPIRSSVGPVNAAGLSKLVMYLLDDIALPIVNDLLKTGFPLPSFDGVTLTKPEISFQDGGYFVIGTDFTWSPPKSDQDTKTQQQRYSPLSALA